MSIDLPEWLTDVTKLASLLTGLSTVVGLVACSVLMITRRKTDHPIKLTATIVLLAMAFAANSAFVYALTIFIVATLVTELSFLEKLAAIVWNRNWAVVSGTATPAEVSEKAEAEVKALPTPTATSSEAVPAALPRETVPQLVGKELLFQSAVTGALASSSSPFPSGTVAPNPIVTTRGTKLRPDAILELPNVALIIEINTLRQPDALQHATTKAQANSNLLGRLASKTYGALPVAPLVVVRDSPNLPLQLRGVPILRYDPDTSRFTNGDEIAAIVASWQGLL